MQSTTLVAHPLMLVYARWPPVGSLGFVRVSTGDFAMTAPSVKLPAAVILLNR